ncbi:MAG: ABC transporter ATP-binding protein [Dehalococcoidia bacterium]
MALIQFYDVSKRFVLHHEKYRSFQEVFVNMFRPRRAHEEFWALRNVSFEIDQGESVAIVGPNGSGKSTTLKLVSRILQPTNGKVLVTKRVSALLELGAGFHPELTGRENVFLNGSLLGFSKADMLARFDDIIEFAELEQFIDTPIKHYSTGMVTRLGFAVAVYTDPEILITDEVLAVGDEGFQRKCLDRIWQFRREGRTIIFVSHALSTVRSLCARSIWLHKGQLMADGPSADVVDSYMIDAYKTLEKKSHAERNAGTQRWGSGEVIITDVSFLDGDGRRRDVFETGETFVIRVEYLAQEKVEQPQLGIGIHRADGVHVAAPNNVAARCEAPFITGRGAFEYRVDQLPLLQGDYEITAAIYDHEAIHPYDHHHRMYTLHVWNGAGAADRWGLVNMPGEWSIETDGAR